MCVCVCVCVHVRECMLIILLCGYILRSLFYEYLGYMKRLLVVVANCWVILRFVSGSFFFRPLRLLSYLFVDAARE